MLPKSYPSGQQHFALRSYCLAHPKQESERPLGCLHSLLYFQGHFSDRERQTGNYNRRNLTCNCVETSHRHSADSPSSTDFKWGRGKKSPCLGSVCRLDFGALLDHASISGCAGNNLPVWGRREQEKEGGCAVLWLSGLVELDQFAPLSQEEKGKLHAGVLSSSEGSTQWQPSGVLGKKLGRILPFPLPS